MSRHVWWVEGHFEGHLLNTPFMRGQADCHTLQSQVVHGDTKLPLTLTTIYDY